ncbi:MAG: phospho-sugar mutase [Opitutae bacterium]|nr:phospho-sugar mutase [Opitutae bacterium]
MNLECKIEALSTEQPLLGSSRRIMLSWLRGDFLPNWALRSLEELVELEAWEELNDRFYQNLTFGTGGMRGRTVGKVPSSVEQGTGIEPLYPAVGSSYLNDFNLLKATIGLFHYVEGFLQESGRGHEVPMLVIGHDVRYFSRHFCELSASVWGRLGGVAQIFDGPRSTPQVSFTVRHIAAHAGIVITASHNPPHDNGFKVYFEDGAQIVPPHAEGIIAQVEAVDWAVVAQYLEKDLSHIRVLPAGLDLIYQDSVKESLVNAELIHQYSPKVVFTSIHGTGRIASIPLLKDLGVEVSEVEAQAVMDGGFSTVKSPNPENAEALQMGIDQAKATNSDVLIGTDPDADRMGVAVRDTNGEMVLLTGNMIGSMLAEYRLTHLKDKGVLPLEGSPNAALIKTFVTTPLQESIAKAHGLKLINTLTGFKWIGEKLRHYEETLCANYLEATGVALDYDATPPEARAKLLQKYSTYYVFGGEESYGYLASDRVRDKDANAAVVMFCELGAWLRSSGQSYLDYLDAIYLKYGFYYEKLGNIYYEGAAGTERIQAILKSYQEQPPKSFSDRAVTIFKDFSTGEHFDSDGKRIPPERFFFLELEGGYSFAVRASGTEPKIKFYVFGCEAVTCKSELATVKDKTAISVEVLLDVILADARNRAGE